VAKFLYNRKVLGVRPTQCRCRAGEETLEHSQVLQAEHMNMRIIERIYFYVLMEEGPAHRLIVVLHPLSAD